MVDRASNARGNATARDAAAEANGIQPAGESVGLPLDDFRREIAGCLERVLRAHKAETVAAAVDRKRSTVYRWAADPEDVPLTAIPALATFDPDPEFLARVAGALLAIVAQRAVARQAQGRALMVFHEIAPGRFGR